MRTTIDDLAFPQEQFDQVMDMIIIGGCDSNDISDKTKAPSLPTLSQTSATESSEMESIEFTFKVVRLSRTQRIAFLNIIEEAYMLRKYILKKVFQGEDPWEIRPWLISFYSITNGSEEIFKHIEFLDQNMIEYIIDDVRNLYELVRMNKASKKIFLTLNASEQKYLILNQYGFSHNFISSDLLRIMGVSEPVKLQWTDQLDSFKSLKYGPIKIKFARNSLYVTLSCMVSSEELKHTRPGKSNCKSHTFQPISKNFFYYEDYNRKNSNKSCPQKRHA